MRWFKSKRGLRLSININVITLLISFVMLILSSLLFGIIEHLWFFVYLILLYFTFIILWLLAVAFKNSRSFKIGFRKAFVKALKDFITLILST